jgi:hypothetical protein
MSRNSGAPKLVLECRIRSMDMPVLLPPTQE